MMSVLLCIMLACVPYAYCGDTTMIALVADSYVGNDYNQLKLGPVALPPAATEGTARIQIVASSVNPIDWHIVNGSMSHVFPLKFPVILGTDVAGTVLECPGCLRLKKGDAVWGSMGFALGAYASQALSPESQFSLKPASLSMMQAASLPVVAMTSLQAMQWAGAPWSQASNTTVLILSGSGGTGFAAVQIAKAMGAASVIAVTSSSNVAWVRSLGADVVVDYHKESVWDVVPADSVDVVYDNLGHPGDPDLAMGKLKPGGRLVVLAGAPASHLRPGRTQKFLIMNSSDYTSLDTMHAMVEEGSLHPHVQQVFPLTQFVKAFQTQQAGHVVGKLGISVSM